MQGNNLWRNPLYLGIYCIVLNIKLMVNFINQIEIKDLNVIHFSPLQNSSALQSLHKNSSL